MQLIKWSNQSNKCFSACIYISINHSILNTDCVARGHSLKFNQGSITLYRLNQSLKFYIWYRLCSSFDKCIIIYCACFKLQEKMKVIEHHPEESFGNNVNKKNTKCIDFVFLKENFQKQVIREICFIYNIVQFKYFCLGVCFIPGILFQDIRKFMLTIYTNCHFFLLFHFALTHIVSFKSKTRP